MAAEGMPAAAEATLTHLTVQDSVKVAVLQTTQTAVSLVASASGVLLYSPNSTVLDGVDFSNFLIAAHKNSAVTGKLSLHPMGLCP